MSEFNLVSEYKMSGDQPQAVKLLVESLKKGNRFQTLEGVTGSGKTFSMANIICQLNKPTLVLSHNKTLAAQLYNELKSFFPNNAVEYFVSYYDYYQPEAYIPQRDLYIEKDSAINEAIDRLRLAATASLLSRRDVIVVASVSCIYGLGSPEDYEDMTLCIDKNIEISRNSIIKSLVDIQYERNDIDFQPGHFRVRGDTLEIFPAYTQNALRVEMFDDEIEVLAWINPITGKQISEIEKIIVFPAKHFVINEDKLKLAKQSILKELEEQLCYLDMHGKALEANRLESRTRYDMEMLEEIGYCKGIENYSRHFSNKLAGEPPATLLDFFPNDYLMVVDESHVSLPQVRGMYNGDFARKSNLVNHGFRLPSALDNRPLKFNEFKNRINQVIMLSATPSEFEYQTSSIIAKQIIRPTGLMDPPVEIRPAKSQIVDVMDEVKNVISQGHRALLTTLTKKLSEDLTSFLQEQNFKAEYLHSGIDTLERIEILQKLRSGEVDVLIGVNLLREGLDLPEVAFVGILDADREGFLRSTTSLIQTIGRAARHVDSKVVLYADIITKSIKETVAITAKRRKIQAIYNKQNGITPKSIKRQLQLQLAELGEAKKVAEKPVDYGVIDFKERQDIISLLEAEMLEASKSLQFEEAAKLRDEIIKLKSDI